MKEKTSVAIIGRSVKTRKPTIHGIMKSIPLRNSRFATGPSLRRDEAEGNLGGARRFSMPTNSYNLVE
jgi:hypothetical protein